MRIGSVRTVVFVWMDLRLAFPQNGGEAQHAFFNEPDGKDHNRSHNDAVGDTRCQNGKPGLSGDHVQPQGIKPQVHKDLDGQNGCNYAGNVEVLAVQKHTVNDAREHGAERESREVGARRKQHHADYIGHGGGNPAPDRPVQDTGHCDRQKAEADPQNGHGYREESREYNLQRDQQGDFS